MKVFIINLFLSRKGGGIFTVLKELYSSFIDSKLMFYGYKDDYSKVDSKILNGEVQLFERENSFFYSGALKSKLKGCDSNSIIHLHTLWMYPSFFLSKFKVAKKIISPHGMLDKWALKNGNLKKRICLNFFEKRNLMTADCIHALCYQEYLDIRKIAPRTPVAIIPNGINLPADKQVELKSQKRVLFLARLHPKKGLDNLIEAWGKSNTEDWCLWIVGPDEGKYEHKIKEKNKSFPNGKNKIVFSKGVFGKDKEEMYRKSSLFILPSYSEGLPMTILEAWSYKLPVLMTKECNLEIGFKENAAIKIDSSVDSIIRGLEKTFQLSEGELVCIGQNGFELVKNEFTWKEVSKKMETLYKWVLLKDNKPDFVQLN